MNVQASPTVDTSGLPLAWSEFDDMPIFLSNYFLVQHQPDEFILTLGQVTGPPLVGTPEGMGVQANGPREVPISTLARVGLTRQRVTELIALLQAGVEEHDRIMGS